MIRRRPRCERREDRMAAGPQGSAPSARGTTGDANGLGLRLQGEYAAGLQGLTGGTTGDASGSELSLRGHMAAGP